MSNQKSSGGPYCICRSYDDTRFMICCDRCNQWFHGDCVRVKEHDSKKISKFYCPPCQKSNPVLQTIYRNNSPLPSSAINSKSTNFGMPPSNFAPILSSSSHKGGGHHSMTEIREKRPDANDSIKIEPKRQKLIDYPPSSNCGKCIGCFRKENCGRCDICKKDSTDTNEKCLLRRCVNIRSTSSSGTGGGGGSKDVTTDDDEPHVDRRKRVNVTPKSNAKLKNVSRGKVGRPPKQKPDDTSKSTTTSSGGTRASARAYRNFLKDAGVLPNSDDEQKSGRGGKSAPKQCYGPNCIYAARPQSKYCSDACGMKLAEVRMHDLLPSRLQQWYARPPVVEEYEKRRLERIKNELEIGRARLSQLDIEEQELNAWRDKCKNVRSKENDNGGGGKSGKSSSSSKSSNKLNESDDPETSVYCVTCGNETSMKNAIKHFAKCFSKYESQTSYGSSFKAISNLYSIFCDTYNKANRTYCKRLRVICPEHSKEAKVDAHEICGSPLQVGQFLKTTTTTSANNDFDMSTTCMTLKKTCTKHYRWMQIRRALIDMERLTQLLRLEELSEETRCIQMAQHSRGNVLGLLLHQTVTHDDQDQAVQLKEKQEKEEESLKKEIVEEEKKEEEKKEEEKKEEEKNLELPTTTNPKKEMEEKIETLSKSMSNTSDQYPTNNGGMKKFPSKMSQKIEEAKFGLTFEQRQNDLEKGVYGD